jgi:hypothetical protein
MRQAISLLLFALSVFVAGCSGGGDTVAPPGCPPGSTFCDSFTQGYALEAVQAAPAAPIPLGVSMEFTFDEMLCAPVVTQGPNQNVLSGCQPPFTPMTLNTSVAPITDSGPSHPCGLSAVVTSPGVVTFTRTGPGDLMLRNGTGATGFCSVTVSDPTHGTGTAIPQVVLLL